MPRPTRSTRQTPSPSTSPASPGVRPPATSRGTRRRGRTAGAAGATAMLLGVAGCTESRRAEYDAILRDDVARVESDVSRFAAAFPEARPAFAVADADR